MPKKLNADATATHKALQLYTLLLFSGKRYFLQELAELCQCTKPTVMRLMREMESSGFVQIISGIEQGKRWYQLADLSGTPHISLSVEELERLTLCRDLIEHILPGGTDKLVSDALARVSLLTRSAEDRASSTATKGTSMVRGYIDYTPFQHHIDTILKAIPQRTVCAITYTAPGKEPRVFDVVPVRLTADGESLYMEGWRVTDRGTPQIRFPTTLAIHRMQECAHTRRTLNECPDLPESQGAFGLIGDEPFPVRVRFTAEHAMHIRERLWSKGQRIADLPGGGVELWFTATSAEQVISWVLGFGAGAELVEPADVRSRIQQAIVELGTIYLVERTGPNDR